MAYFIKCMEYDLYYDKYLIKPYPPVNIDRVITFKKIISDQGPGIEFTFEEDYQLFWLYTNKPEGVSERDKDYEHLLNNQYERINEKAFGKGILQYDNTGNKI